MMIEREIDDDNNDDEYNFDGCLDYSRINITIIHLISMDDYNLNI